MSLGGAMTDGRLGGARREGGLQLLWGRDQTPSALSLPPSPSSRLSGGRRAGAKGSGRGGRRGALVCRG